MDLGTTVRGCKWTSRSHNTTVDLRRHTDLGVMRSGESQDMGSLVPRSFGPSHRCFVSRDFVREESRNLGGRTPVTVTVVWTGEIVTPTVRGDILNSSGLLVGYTW